MAAFADGVAGGGAVNEGVGAPRGAAVGGFGGEELRAGAGDVAEVEPRGEEAAVGGDGEGVQALAGAAGNVVDKKGPRQDLPASLEWKAKSSPAIAVINTVSPWAAIRGPRRRPSMREGRAATRTGGAKVAPASSERAIKISGPRPKVR
jgi:hypothetical protein